MVNEFLIGIMAVIMFGFTDFVVDIGAQTSLGYAFCITLGIYLAVNIFVLFGQSYRLVRQKIRRYRAKRKRDQQIADAQAKKDLIEDISDQVFLKFKNDIESQFF